MNILVNILAVVINVVIVISNRNYSRRTSSQSNKISLNTVLIHHHLYVFPNFAIKT